MTTTGHKRLAIIGAGAAGVCAARRAVSLLCNWVPYVFELGSQVGGTWIYDDNVGINPSTGDPIHSSMYKGLKTNLPKEVMAFPDYPFPPSSNSFLKHTEVLKYIQDYSSSILKHIQFDTKVVSVCPAKGSKWSIETLNLLKNEQQISEFDAVVVCNGHYSIPAYGHIKGIDSYSGEKLHSHDYRIPEPFKGKRVLVFGAASSGIDISIEIAKYASKVYLSHNNPLYPRLNHIQQVPGIISYDKSSFVLQDNSFLKDIDVLLYCTGYKFDFPFLHKDCGITVDNLEERRVHDLYKHCINVKCPSMCLIGIPMQICPFPVFDTQIQFFYKILSGEYILPNMEAMLDEIEKEFKDRQSKGLHRRHFHKFGEYQWKYIDDLSNIGNFPQIQRRVQIMYELVSKRRQEDIQTYRQTRFEMDGENSIKLLEREI